MRQIVLISCVKTKLEGRVRARDLFISSYFKKRLKYAESLNPDRIFILSSKYGLLTLDEKVESYDVELSKMPAAKRRQWASGVLASLKKSTDLKRENFIILASRQYREYILAEIKHYEIPMEGLSRGKQLQWLNENT
jgi:hypothetical protein